MDISDTLTPTSDQLDAVELLGGPRTFTVESVSKVEGEQPLNVRLAEFPRPWRPGKSMRRILGYCWGTDASKWAGRRVQLYCDPGVMFGKDRVGGTRISALSHIDRPKDIPLPVSRGKSQTYHVDVLPDERNWRAEADALTTRDELLELYRQAPAEHHDYIKDRAQQIAVSS